MECGIFIMKSYTKYTKEKVKKQRRLVTRKLSYCKDDRAMRPIYGFPENFRESPTPSMPTATFPEIFNGLLLRSIL